MKTLTGWILLLLVSCSQNSELKHTVAPVNWAEELGNHRAGIEIRKQAGAIYLHLPWRRHDPVPGNKNRVKITAPYIEDFQPEQLFGPDDRIPVDPLKGWLLAIETNEVSDP
ncbi:MAG: hypothetical protein KFF73_14260 [Cyclobacteriaceae bacterium]|nr:hypothetical protein [Cyclobacteriaceae bacterium]